MNWNGWSNGVDFGAKPTLDELGQLVTLVALREEELRRRKESADAEAHVRAEELLAGFRLAASEVLHGQGVGWLFQHSRQIQNAGHWEQVVELWSVEWELPGFRRFKLMLGRWTNPRTADQQADFNAAKWRPAESCTGEEVPSWYANDESGREQGCNCLREALCVAMVRIPGQFGPATVEIKP